MNMKKLLTFFAISLITTAALSAQQLTLKEVIAHSARGIEETLPPRSAVAILSFASDSVKFSEYVIEELTSELLEGGKIPIVDRRNLALVREEMNLQLSGDVSDESAVSIGKMLGARFIITGTLTDMKTYQQFRIRIVNVQTAAIERQITSELQNDEEVAYLLGGDAAVKKLREENERIARTRPTSNVRNNWVSADTSSVLSVVQVGGAAGARYERMINSRISAGANFFWLVYGTEPEIFGSVMQKNIVKQEYLDRGNNFGIEAFFRFYPWGRKFYVGTGIGYFNIGKQVDIVEYKYSGNSTYGYVVGIGEGVGFSLEAGWKIDLGKEGGFFIQPGISGIGIFGKVDDSNAPVNTNARPTYKIKSEIIGDRYANLGMRVYFAGGWAF